MTVIALRFPFVGTPEQVRQHAGHVDHQQIREGWSYLDLRDAVGVVYAGLSAPVAGAHVVGVSAPDTYRPEPSEDLLAEHAPGVPLRRRVPQRGALIDTSRARERLGFVSRYSVADEGADHPAAPPGGRPVLVEERR